MKRIKSKIGLHGRGISEAADWVKEHGKVENHPFIRREMVSAYVIYSYKYPALTGAMLCFKFY